jgi:hypothetical protein
MFSLWSAFVRLETSENLHTFQLFSSLAVSASRYWHRTVWSGLPPYSRPHQASVIRAVANIASINDAFANVLVNDNEHANCQPPLCTSQKNVCAEENFAA